MPDPQHHAENRNFVEKILNYIPGFHGYLQKEYRRDSDHLARVWLADRLQQSKRGLDDYQRALLEAALLDALPPCERLRSRLDGLINKIKGAVRGYSGFFDYVRVDEQRLDAVYQLDMALMKDVEDFASSLEQLGSAMPESSPRPINDLIRHLDEVDQKFAQRGNLLKGLGE